MLSLKPFKFGQSILVNSVQTEVLEGYEPYFEDGFWDFLRPNKKARKLHAALMLQQLLAFNNLAAFDVSQKGYNDFLKTIEQLHADIETRLRLLKKIIEVREGKIIEQQQTNSQNRTNNISIENLKAMSHNEMHDFSKLAKLSASIAALYNSLKIQKDQVHITKQLEFTNGQISSRDDVDFDPAIFDYAISPTYTHPFNKYASVTLPDLEFAIKVIYSSEDENMNSGLEHVLQIQTRFLSEQWYMFPFASTATRDFTRNFSKLLYLKEQEVKGDKQGVAQSAYNLLTHTLLDQEMLPIKSFETLSNFVEKHGKFTTYILECKDLDHVIDFTSTQLKELKSPRFGIFRPEAVAEYTRRKAYWEALTHTLESFTFDTRGLIEQAKNDSNNSFLPSLLNEANLSIDNLFDITVNGENKNLKEFIGFLEIKEKELVQQIKATNIFTRNLWGKKDYQLAQKRLTYMQAFKKAAKVSDDAKETKDSTDKIKLVIDSEEKQKFIKEYNERRRKDKKHALHTGISVQLIEERIYYKSKETISSDRKKFVADPLFSTMVEVYNAYRQNHNKSKIEYTNENINKEKAYEQIRKNGDFSDFVKAYQRAHEKNADDKYLQLNEYFVDIKVDMEYVEDRFLYLVQEYKQFQASRPVVERKQNINDNDFLICTEENTDISTDKTARHNAYDQINKNNDFSEFVAWYKQKFAEKPIIDISDRNRSFIHYLERFERNINNPSRYLSEQLKERIQDAYDRFSDLIVYHGVNPANIKQAVRYINLMIYVIDKWEQTGCQGTCPISVIGVDLTKEAERKQFLEGLVLAKKIINGETIAEYLVVKVEVTNEQTGDSTTITTGELKEEARTNLSKILPMTKFQDTGYSSIERLLFTRFSRVHLSHHFMGSKLTQKEKETKDNTDINGLASVTELTNIIKNTGIIDIEKQYQEIASDALSYFRSLLYSTDQSGNLQPRLVRNLLISIKPESTNVGNFDNYDKYLTEAYVSTSTSRPTLAFLKRNLSIKKQKAEKSAATSEDIHLGEVFYASSIATMKRLLAWISFNKSLSAKLRTEIVQPYLKALEEAKTAGNLELAVLENYAIVFSTIFTRDELKRVAKLIFSIIFDPQKIQITISEKIKVFINENKEIIAGTLYEAIDEFIATTTNRYDAITSDTIFTFGNLKNKQGYSLIRLKELLAIAAADKDRMAQPALNEAEEFINYINSKKLNNIDFFFNETQLQEAFGIYPGLIKEEVNFWRQAIDRLACEYYISDEGKNYIRKGRKSQIIFLLYKNLFVFEGGIDDITAIDQFYRYTQKHGSEIKVSQENIDIIFQEFLDNKNINEILATVKHTTKLHQLNKAERLALYFDDSGKWLDEARLMKIDLILNGELDVTSFIDMVKNAIPFRLFPATAEGKQAFFSKLREKFFSRIDGASFALTDYKYTDLNLKINQLAIEFDKDGEIIDQIRLAEMIAIYQDHPDIVLGIESVIFKIQNIQDLQPPYTFNGKSIKEFPLTALGRKELNSFFAAVIMPDGSAAPIKVRYQYHHVVEQIALHFDSEQFYFDKIRIAKIANLLQEKNIRGAQSYVVFIDLTNTEFNKKFPAHTESDQELQELFLAHIYPNGIAEEKINIRYAYHVTTEYLTFKYGNEDTKQKCILARIADIFTRVNSSTDNLAESYIKKFEEDGHGKLDENGKLNGLTLNHENQTALNNIFKYYVEYPQPWNPNIERLLEAFEPKVNNGQYLQAYRLKRLTELFTEEKNVVEFSDSEYLKYQGLLGQDSVATNNNFDRIFGKENKPKLQNLFQDYILRLLQLWKNKQEYELNVITKSKLFDLAILLITDGILGDTKIPVGDQEENHQFGDIIIAGENIAGKNYYITWLKLISEYHKLKEVVAIVNAAKSNLNKGAYETVRNIYKGFQLHRSNFTDISEDTEKEYIRKLSGIVAITKDVVKELVGYQQQLEPIQEQIESICGEILTESNLNRLRENVESLITIFEMEIPEFASQNLRKEFMRLKHREEQLKRNLISICGASDLTSAQGLVELLRLIPIDEPARSQYVTAIKEYYALLTKTDKKSLPELKQKSTELVLKFINLCFTASQNEITTAFNNYITADFSKEIDCTVEIRDSIATILSSSNITAANKVKAILSIIKAKLYPYHQLFASLLTNNASLEVEIIPILNKIYEGNEIKRENIPTVLSDLLQYLHTKLIFQKLTRVVKIISVNEINTLSNQQLRNIFIDLIRKVTELLEFKLEDTQEFIASLEEFKNDPAATFSLDNLRNLLIGLKKASQDQQGKEFVNHLAQIIASLNQARFTQKNKEIAKNIDDQHDTADIIKLLREINEKHEKQTVKLIAKSIMQVNESEHIEQKIKEIQEEFVSCLPTEAQAEINYVKINIDNINESYTKLTTLLTKYDDTVCDGKFSANLANFESRNFEYLRKGLDNDRLNKLTQLLNQTIKSEHSAKDKSLSLYLIAIRDYLHQRIDDITEAHQTFSTYAVNLTIFLTNLNYLQTSNYQQLNFDATITAFNNIINQLSLQDKAYILYLIHSDENPINLDINSVFLSHLFQCKMIESSKEIVQRCAAYQEIMRKLTSPAANYANCAVTKDEIKIIKAESNSMETVETVEAMHKSIRSAITSIVEKEKGEYYQSFRDLIMTFGSAKEQNNMMIMSMSLIIAALHQTCEFYKNNKANFSQNFMSDNDIEDLKFILDHYKGDQDLRERLQVHLQVFITTLCNKDSDITDLNTFITSGKTLITILGSNDQIKLFETIVMLKQYIDIVNNQTEYYQLRSRQRQLAMDIASSANADLGTLFDKNHKKLLDRIEINQVLGAAKIVCAVAEIEQENISTFSLNYDLPYILEKLLDIKNKKLGDQVRKLNSKSDKTEFNNFINAIATIYLFCQVAPSALDKEINDRVDTAFKTFITSYINFRNDPNVPPIDKRSLPCTTALAQALINNFGLPGDLEKVKVAEKRWHDNCQIHKLAQSWVDILANTRISFQKSKGNINTVKDSFSSSRGTLHTKLNELCSSIEQKDIPRFIKYFNQELKNKNIDHKIEIKWQQVDLTLDTLRPQIEKTFISVLSQELEKKNKNDAPELIHADNDLSRSEFSYIIKRVSVLE